MTIHIVKGTGTGSTELSAFDSALIDAGIANYNLIYLSSIIPHDSDIKFGFSSNDNKDFGHKAYVVISKNVSSVKNTEIWSGLGWVQDEEKKDLFVEHVGFSKNEVTHLITDSLNHMKQNRTDNFKIIHSESIGIKCVNQPVCCLVVAIYKIKPW